MKQEIKNTIQQDISSKTQPNSISPGNIGNPMNSLVDASLMRRGYWDIDIIYSKDEIIDYNGEFYICETNHTSSYTYRPDITPTHWNKLGMKKVVSGSTTRGEGTAASPLTLNYYTRSSKIKATGTNAPVRQQNYFIGMELPDGITESFARTEQGTYEIIYTGNIDIPWLDITNSSYYHEIRFFNNPDIRLYTVHNTIDNVNNTRTLTFVFINSPAGVITDAFSNLLYEIRFYKN